MLAAIDRTSAQSLFRRFFGARREFPKKRSTFLDVNFVDHVAIVAKIDESGKKAIVGGARYIKLNDNEAEVAFAVIDPFQGQGLGTILIRHIAALARTAGTPCACRRGVAREYAHAEGHGKEQTSDDHNPTIPASCM